MQVDGRAYEKDWPNLPIKHLILADKDFIVFLDEQFDVDWSTTDDFDQRSQTEEEKKQLNFILNEMANVESYPCHDISNHIIISFKRQIGESLVRAFEKDFDNARLMIKQAKRYIIDRNMEQSRYMYLYACGIATLISGISGVLLWLLRNPIIGLTGETMFFALLSCLVGAFGAFLSVILRIGKTNLDFNASKKLHYMEAISRIIAGMICGFLIALCIKAGIILPIFNKIESTHLAMVLGGLIAGSSERLAPSIIKKFDSSK
ncbi:hypothetical protein G7092_05780 [Mucilaginibacter sp. HC2]|uniref:hypothetical protein n=1 Tax=Mucilaginibacter inviolabilis TaxID=2714892 RepID=UPI00140E08EE|nr:hypothetical protein [Mucilaginibacter inviolabilis]NHA03291.1 hypothetical protein [Mucilaginibacter inviolabilis]